MCGSSLLNGPATQPAGSVRVDPAVDYDLQNKTLAHPAGTTFWLAPGTHTLGTDQFGQVRPKDGNTYLGAPGAVLDGRNMNRYAFAGTGTRVTIKYLTIRNFGTPTNLNINEGVVNTNASSGWTISYNTVANNHGAGVFMGSDTTVTHNCLDANGQYGFSGYRPPVAGDSAIKNVVIDHNEISRNNTDDVESRIAGGCGCTGGGKFWDVKGARVTNNWVHHNKGVGLWADTNNIDFVFEGNYVNDNDNEGIWYEISYNAAIRNNTLIRNALVKGRAFAAQGSGFPVGAIYIAESGGDSRVDPNNTTLVISGNHLEDNWGGVVLWESGDRFCGSPNNTSSGYCTRVNPSVSLSTCSDPATGGQINVEPYRSDCRWKTQNVTVTNNDFRINKSALNCLQQPCGMTALRSSYATSPSWSPYLGDVVPTAITFHQNNRFSNNRYVGDWSFQIFNGTLVNWDGWRAAPYHQDSGSTLSVPPVNFTAPPDLPGLQFWYNADTLGLPDAAPVASWADGSSHGRTLSATGSEQPTYRKGVLGGRPVVRFNGANRLSTAAVASIPQPSTICVVGSAASWGSGWHAFVDTGVTAYNQQIALAGGRYTTWAGATLTGPAADKAPHVLCAVFSGAFSTLRVDGGAAWTGNAGTYGITGLTLGRAPQGDQPLTGDIAEVVIYSSALPTTYLDQLGNYLASRYGLTWTSAGTGPATSDTTPPTAPGGLTAKAISATQVDLAWSAATDNVGVTRYTVFRNGTVLAVLGASSSYSDTTAQANSKYSYYVVAGDAAGNSGPASNTVTVTTGAPATATISASPTSVKAGSPVTATWSGISSPTTTDWIGLYTVGAADTSYRAWRYTTGTASGNAALTVPAGTPAGTYELRLFAQNGYTRLATSNPITVT